MGNWGKICVGTRLEKGVDSRFVKCWTNLIMRGLRKGDGVLVVDDKVAHQASNALAREFLRTGCDTLFMLDSDADIGPNFLNEFRDYEPGWQYDLLQAFYCRRGWPPDAIWFKKSHHGDMFVRAVYGEDVVEDVAIIGTHAVLIRREVFIKLLGDRDEEKFDWFFYPRHETASEDGAFSQEAADAGFRLGATTHVKAGHISRVTTGWETYQEYLQLSGSNAMIERYQAMLKLIGDFTGEGPDMVQSKVLRASKNVLEAWKDPENAKQARAFYGQADNGYLYDLMAWNFSPVYERLTAPLRAYHGKRVLVVGAGIGGEVEQLIDHNEVEAFELPGVLRDFCQARFGGRVDFDFGETICMSALRMDYQLIVMIDVVEHIHPDEFDETMEVLARRLEPGGRFYIHTNFAQQNAYPMHYDHSARFAAWLKRHGLKRQGDTCVYM
jgi:SAM-dependent methyltransferase